MKDMTEFRKNVINTWGDKGKRWLVKLPELVVSLSSHWDLAQLIPVSNMSYNYVSLAKQKKIADVVLKISCHSSAYQQELLALQYFNGKGSVSVIKHNDTYNALLLAQAVPGVPLKVLAKECIDLSIDKYVNVVQSIYKPLQNHLSFAHVSIWCKAIDRINSDMFKHKWVLKAKNIKQCLLESAENEYVCHGDLHLENIVKDKEDWLSIDPKGVIGEKAFEAAAFDWLIGVDLTNTKAIKHAIQARTMKVAKLLDISEQRLLAWVFIKAMISAQWFIEDKGNPENPLQLASHVYSLL